MTEVYAFGVKNEPMAVNWGTIKGETGTLLFLESGGSPNTREPSFPHI